MSYISSLNILTDDTPVPLSEEALNEELALWANAQFTFDTEPGTAVHADPYKSITEPADLFATFTSFNDLSGPSSQALNYQTRNLNIASTTIENNNNGSNYLCQETLLQHRSQLPSQAIALQQQQQHHALPPKQHTSLPRLAPAPIPQKPLTNVTLSQPVSPLNNGSLSNKNNAPSISSSPTLTTSSSNNSKKRKTTVKDSLTEMDKEAIEEDKRRRNTAASARFRMKKKLREQALERTAQEMTLKAETLEKRVHELEKEVKWLRALVVEKNPSLLPKQL